MVSKSFVSSSGPGVTRQERHDTVKHQSFTVFKTYG